VKESVAERLGPNGAQFVLINGTRELTLKLKSLWIEERRKP